MKNYFKLSLFQLRKKSNILAIILITIILVLIVLLGTYLKSQTNNLKVPEDPKFKRFMVYKNKEEMLMSKEEREKELKELEQIKHVVMATPEYAYYTHFKNPFQNYEHPLTIIELHPGTNKSIPKITKGRGFSEDNIFEVVCPENFIPVKYEDLEKMSVKDKVLEEELLNKEVWLEAPRTNPSKMYNLRIVGLYKNNDYFVDEDYCYLNTMASKVVSEVQFKNNFDSDGIPMINFYNGFIIEIDSLDNYEEFDADLKAHGYLYDVEMISYDKDAIQNITNNLLTGIYSLVTLSFIIILLLLFQNFKEDKSYYDLLYHLGYTTKEISGLYFVSNFIKILFCIIIASIISAFLVLGSKTFLEYYPFLLSKWRIFFSFESIIFVLIASIMAIIISGIINLKRFKNGAL